MNIVKELRKKKGIQQKELAIITGVAQPTVSEWESNKKDPSGERLRKLAEYFGVDELVILGAMSPKTATSIESTPQTIQEKRACPRPTPESRRIREITAVFLFAVICCSMQK